MRRREFITVVGSAAVWPLAARAQQATMPVIGYLYSGALETGASSVAAFRQGLSEQGFSEGRNVAIEYRWANNDPARLPGLAADLVDRRVAVIVAPGTVAGVRAAKAATTTIPIVFRTGGDPVELGLVTSLNQPGGNITGINAMSLETGTKRLGLLHELLPQAVHFAVLINPTIQMPRITKRTWKRRLQASGDRSFFSTPATTRRSTPHLQVLRKSGPMLSWSFRKVS